MDPLVTPAPRRPRRRARPSQTAVRLAVGALGTLAPGAAVDVSARLMAHVGPPARVRERDRDVHDRARRGVIHVGSERVVTYQWGDDDSPTVLLAHGWQLRASRLATLVRAFEEAGLRVLAFDAVAHGESSGRSANMFQFVAALDALADEVVSRGGEVVGVVGHSLGGLAAGVAVRDGLPAPRWAAIGAPAGMAPIAQVFAAMVGLPSRLVPDLLDAASQRFLDDATAWRRAELAIRPAPPAAAALFVRDVDDAMALPGDARRLHAAHEGSELLVTAGLGHNGVLDDPEVCAAVVGHVTGVRVTG